MPEQVTTAWLTQALRSTGVIGPEAAVQSFTTTRVGEDESFSGGALSHFTLTYDQNERGAPKSLVAKIAPADPEMRAVMKAVNREETRFYTDFAVTTKLPVPRCYYGDFDGETGANILLLEDLTHYRTVNFFTGCNPEEAEQVVRALAHIHVRWWNRPQLAGPIGISISEVFPFGELWSQYPAEVGELLPEVDIPATLFALGDAVAANENAIFDYFFETPPITCLHRDIHVDNILFSRQTSQASVRLVDWQSFGKGRGVYDLAYFMISSLPPTQRRETETDLLRIYYTTLVQSGITDYNFRQCWSDYQLAVVSKLVVTVIATILIDNSSAHRRVKRRTDLQRLLVFCQDHKVLDLITQKWG